MLAERHADGRSAIEPECTEMLVPKDYLLWKIDAQ